MALTIHRIEGFDGLDTATVPKILDVADATVGSPGAAGAGNYLQVSGSGHQSQISYGAIVPLGDRVICGFAFYTTSYSGTKMQFADNGTTEHLHLSLDGTGHLTVTRNGTALTGGVGPTALSLNTWYYIEIEFIVSDTVGEVHVFLNGVEEISTASNLDTKNGGTGAISNIELVGGTSITNRWDDVYFGSAPAADTQKTNFISLVDGPPRISTLVPTGAGNYAQFSPSAGSNWQNVDDAVPDDDATRNSSSTPGQKDSFALADLPAAGTVHVVQSDLYAAKSDAGNRSLQEFLRIGGTDYPASDDVALSTTYAYQRVVRPVNPATGVGWLDSGVNGAELGYLVSV